MLRMHRCASVVHSHDHGLAEVVVVKTGAIPDRIHAHQGRRFYHKVQLQHPVVVDPGSL